MAFPAPTAASVTPDLTQNIGQTPGPQDRGQHLPTAADQQRVEPEPALVVTGGALLVGVRGDRRRVEVEDHFLGRGTGRPCPCPRLRARPAQAVKLCLAD